MEGKPSSKLVNSFRKEDSEPTNFSCDSMNRPYGEYNYLSWTSNHPMGDMAKNVAIYTMEKNNISVGSHDKLEGLKGSSTSDDENENDDNPYHKVQERNKNKKSIHSRRVMEQNGDPNIRYKNISQRRRKYISDFYTTLIDLGWCLTLLLFALSFYISWMTYASLYYLLSWLHGDLLPSNLPTGLRQMNGSWTPCIYQMEDFASAFLFSVETQHTIGYGSRQTSNKCPDAIFLMSTQSVIGCLIQALLVGLVFAKMSRPKFRAHTVAFSKNAVICERDSKLCLILRVGDMRCDSFIVGAHVSVKIIRRRLTLEGEMFHEVKPLKISPDTSGDNIMFLLWPLTIYHVIDKESPFYKKSARDMKNHKFELHVSMEGTVESTSMTFQARTSYVPEEILWGHRFEPMVLYRNDRKKYHVNFSAFNSTYEVKTPKCSAFDLEENKRPKSKNLLGHGVGVPILRQNPPVPSGKNYVEDDIEDLPVDSSEPETPNKTKLFSLSA